MRIRRVVGHAPRRLDSSPPGIHPRAPCKTHGLKIRTIKLKCNRKIATKLECPRFGLTYAGSIFKRANFLGGIVRLWES
eukprot:1161656-Pelagomonas_calceolata.AAC.5